MTKHKQMTIGLVVASLFFHHAHTAFTFTFDDGSDYLTSFPAMCSEASDRMPLPGHTLRVGFIANTPFGWSFLFPDQRSEGMLERVQLLDNAGVVGQHPDADLGADIRLRTGAGQFVVAHVFVGDPNVEPIVTCVSMPMPLASFVPMNYGTRFTWLGVDQFGSWLKYRKYNKWRWRNYWNFNKVRTSFSSYWGRERVSKYNKYSKYRKYRRDDDGKFRRIGNGKWRRIDDDNKRGGNSKWRKIGGDKQTILPITTKPDNDDRRRRFDGNRKRFGANKQTIMPIATKPDNDGDQRDRSRGWRRKDTKSGADTMPNAGSSKVPTAVKPDNVRQKWSSMKPKNDSSQNFGSNDGNRSSNRRTASKQVTAKEPN